MMQDFVKTTHTATTKAVRIAMFQFSITVLIVLEEN